MKEMTTKTRRKTRKKAIFFLFVCKVIQISRFSEEGEPFWQVNGDISVTLLLLLDMAFSTHFLRLFYRNVNALPKQRSCKAFRTLSPTLLNAFESESLSKVSNSK